MSLHLHELCIYADDPGALARFWAVMLKRELTGDNRLLPATDTEFPIRFQHRAVPKGIQNRAHFDLTSTDDADQAAQVARALDLGGRHYDVGQTGDEGHVVLADPEDNEFCVIEPGNRFLAGCGLLGALAGDGTAQVGYFWHEALGWPLVWDQDEETAIQAPAGGTKITWGGPPVAPKTDINRLHFDLRADDVEAEIARLRALGATPNDDSRCQGGGVALLDPDGNEFCVLAAP